MRLALVYQAGIANVFEIGEEIALSGLDSTGQHRDARRVMQHAFGPCEHYCRGAEHAGARVAVYSCNRAGDIQHQPWTAGMADCPFRDAADPEIHWLPA